MLYIACENKVSQITASTATNGNMRKSSIKSPVIQMEIKGLEGKLCAVDDLKQKYDKPKNQQQQK